MSPPSSLLDFLAPAAFRMYSYSLFLEEPGPRLFCDLLGSAPCPDVLLLLSVVILDLGVILLFCATCYG